MTKRIKSYWQGVLFIALIMAGSVMAAPGYVGSIECGICHRDQMADWEKSSHARSFSLLEPGKRRAAKKRAGLDPEKDYQTDTYCLKCHTTGYEKPGGFVDMKTNPQMTGIGCEMCHGPGEKYVTLHKSNTGTFTREEAKAAGQTFGSEDPAVCGKCHAAGAGPFTPDLNKKYHFSLDERLKRIRSYHRYYSKNKR